MVDYYDYRPRYTCEQISTLSHASIPICLLAGDADAGYPVSYAEEFLQDLAEAKVDTEFHIIPDGPHFLNVSNPNEYVVFSLII
jgi:pimeloyl-ACP methyl ester carboxylesterase